MLPAAKRDEVTLRGLTPMYIYLSRPKKHTATHNVMSWLRSIFRTEFTTICCCRCTLEDHNCHLLIVIRKGCYYRPADDICR